MENNKNLNDCIDRLIAQNGGLDGVLQSIENTEMNKEYASKLAGYLVSSAKEIQEGVIKKYGNAIPPQNGNFDLCFEHTIQKCGITGIKKALSENSPKEFQIQYAFALSAYITVKSLEIADVLRKYLAH